MNQRSVPWESLVYSQLVRTKGNNLEWWLASKGGTVLWAWPFNPWKLVLFPDRVSELSWIMGHPAGVKECVEKEPRTQNWCQNHNNWLLTEEVCKVACSQPWLHNRNTSEAPPWKTLIWGQVCASVFFKAPKWVSNVKTVHKYWSEGVGLEVQRLLYKALKCQISRNMSQWWRQWVKWQSWS